MKNFLLRVFFAATVALCATMAANAQERNPASTAPPQQQSAAASSGALQTASEQEPTARPQQEPNEPAANPGTQNEPQMPAAGSDAQTQDAKAFTGRIVKENGKIILKDPVTKNSYQLDDVSKVKSYMGKEVKITGKLDMNSNTIHIETVGPVL